MGSKLLELTRSGYSPFPRFGRQAGKSEEERKWGWQHTESQALTLVWPLGQTSGQVFCWARHQLRRKSVVTLPELMSQQVVKFCAEASPAMAATMRVEKNMVADGMGGFSDGSVEMSGSAISEEVGSAAVCAFEGRAGKW
jgi:hypothetical protein